MINWNGIYENLKEHQQTKGQKICKVHVLVVDTLPVCEYN